MFRKFIILLLFLTFYLTNNLSAQLNVMATVDAASCSANGQIEVEVTGGSGNYTYQLTGPCLDNIPPQPEATFDFLPPCEYTVSVLDRQTNATGEMRVEVKDDYEDIQLSVIGEGCNLRLMVEGGRAPYRFSFSPDGVGGPYQLNDPATSSLFMNLSGADIHLSVEDACGVRRAIATPAVLNPIRGVEFPVTSEEGISVGVIGGNAPYTFRVFNDADTLILTRSFITWDSLLCNAQLEVRDSCSSFIAAVAYEPLGTTLCVNFATGTAEVGPVAGVPPYTFRVITSEGEFTSDTGVFENLPINTGEYEFIIIDACGLERIFDAQTRLRLDVEETDQGCSDDELRLFVARQCAGVLFSPVRVTCQNCIPQETVEVSDFGEGVVWSGFGPGEWDILLENKCGDQTRCQDELIIELTPGCDSIVARIVDLFSCDNGTTGRRVITGDDATFFLQDENGAPLVENNKTGVFENLSQGNYNVVAVLPNCDTLRNATTLAPPDAIDPYILSWVDYEIEEGDCQLFYDISIEKEQGPYILTGGPDNTYEVLNNFAEDNCRFYGVRLRPGTYTLTSMSICGNRILELPEPNYDFSVALVDNCPGDAKLLANGIRTVKEWQTFFDPYQLNIQNLFPGYFIETVAGGSRQEENFTFRGLQAGLHSVYLYPLEERGCAIDTIDITVPEYGEVTIEVAGDVVCDNKSVTDLDIKIIGGQAPYDLRKLDCSSNGTLASFALDSEAVFVDEDLALGGYCYAVSDVCQLGADFQVKVRLFADSIRLGYTCEGLLQLAVDSLPVVYTWLDSGGATLGNQHILSVPVSNQTETYTVQVGLPECVIERMITVPPREIIPVIDIEYSSLKPLICGNGDITLTAVTNTDYQVAWNTGATEREITVTEPEAYIATAINDIGCTQSDTMEVIRVMLPEPKIGGRPGFCLNESTELTLNETYVERQWSTGAQTESIIVNSINWFSVMVTDENGCIGQDSVYVEEWPLPEPVMLAEALICPGATTLAQLTSDYAGYQWSNGTILPTADLPAGTHTVTVTDVNGCREQTDVVIDEKPQLFVNFSGDTTICSGDSVILSLSFTQPWYNTELRILGTAGENVLLQTFGDRNLKLPVSANTVFSIADIVMADYGCPVIPQGTPRIQANQLNLVFREDPIRCPGGSDGALEVFAASDFPPYAIHWNTGSKETIVTGLSEGSYGVRVTDQLGCAVSDSFFLQAPLAIRPSLEILPPLCRGINDGLISVDAVAGGTPPFVWRVNIAGQGQAPGEVSGLPPGLYSVALLDHHDCYWDTTVVFNVPPPLTLDAGEDQIITIGETANLEPITSVSSLIFWHWEASPTMEMDSSLALEVSPFEKTDFTITVLNDYGCELTDQVSVFVKKEEQFEAPNAFSPNGDGRNDFFLLFGKETNIETIDLFEIYDRWGNKVFGTESMELNNELTGWDGRQNGQLLNAGVYVWMAKVRRIDGEEVMVYGDVALIR